MFPYNNYQNWTKPVVSKPESLQNFLNDLLPKNYLELFQQCSPANDEPYLMQPTSWKKLPIPDTEWIHAHNYTKSKF